MWGFIILFAPYGTGHFVQYLGHLVAQNGLSGLCNKWLRDTNIKKNQFLLVHVIIITTSKKKNHIQYVCKWSAQWD